LLCSAITKRNLLSLLGTAVAQWLRRCATTRKDAGSIPAGVIGFFNDIKPFLSHQYFMGRDSSVRIATGYGLDGPGIESRLGEIFRTRPDRPWGPPSLLYNGYRISLPGVKRPQRGIDHPLHLAPRLKKEYSYNYSPFRPSWPVLG